jgi:hypothetical protein
VIDCITAEINILHLAFTRLLEDCSCKHCVGIALVLFIHQPVCKLCVNEFKFIREAQFFKRAKVKYIINPDFHLCHLLYSSLNGLHEDIF